MATEVELALMAYKVYALSEENYIDINGWTQVAPSHTQTDGFAGSESLTSMSANSLGAR